MLCPTRARTTLVLPTCCIHYPLVSLFGQGSAPDSARLIVQYWNEAPEDCALRLAAVHGLVLPYC